MRNRRIVLRSVRPEKYPPARLAGHIRVTDAAEMEVRRLAFETGLSLCTVASELLKQAAAECEILYPEGGDLYGGNG